MTDIVQIAFNDRPNIDQTTAISLLYALIGAAERVLCVERNEISGVIRFDSAGYNTNYRFILFDNVPGGAGYVKRLVDDDNDFSNLKMVFSEAYRKTKYCDCDEHSSCYKCLRTYENQKYHEVLSRIDVADFLETYVDKEIKMHKSVTVDIKNNGYPHGCSDWDMFFSRYDNILTPKAQAIIKSSGLTLPDCFFPEISIDGSKSIMQPSLCWVEKKVFIFDKSKKDFINSIGNAAEIGLFVDDDGLDIEAIKNKLKEGEKYGSNDSK